MSRHERYTRHCFHRLRWHLCAHWFLLSIPRLGGEFLAFFCKSWTDFPELSDTGKAGSCRRHFDCWTPAQYREIFECSVKFIRAAVFASMFVSFAFVILAITCRRELFRSKYRSFALLTVNSMAIPGWIVASGAYSLLNSFLITFCCIIDPNRSNSLVICSVTSPPIVASFQIINNWLLVRWIFALFGFILIYSFTAQHFNWPSLIQIRQHDRWIVRRCVVLVSPHFNLLGSDLVDRGA